MGADGPSPSRLFAAALLGRTRRSLARQDNARPFKRGASPLESNVFGLSASGTLALGSVSVLVAPVQDCSL